MLGVSTSYLMNYIDVLSFLMLLDHSSHPHSRLRSILLLLVIENRPGNTIQILLSDARHPAPASALAQFRHLHFFQLEQHAADDPGIGLAEVFGTRALAHVPPVPLAQLSDAHARAEVHLPGDARGADVIPVVAVRGEFVGHGRLDEIGPRGQFELVGILQMFGVRLDEGLGRDVSDTDTTRFLRHGGVALFATEIYGEVER